MAKQNRCFVHSGRGRSLCARHRREARALAAKWGITLERAVFELRDFEHDVAEARSLIRTIARSKSKRSRA